MKNVIADHFKENLKFGNLFYVNIYRILPNFIREFAVYALAFIAPLNSPKKKFVIYAQGRTGSTLLVDLINSHPDVFTYGEIFHKSVIKNVRNPLRFATGLMTLNKKPVRGFKMKIYQLTNDQNKDPENVLKLLLDKGWKIIYLHRDNFFLHAISDLRSEKTKVWHELKSTENLSNVKINISYDELIAALEFREKNQIKEQDSLRDVDHFSVSYEENLSDSNKQKVFSKKLLNYLELSDVDLNTKLRKVTKGSPSDVIENFNLLEKKLEKTRFSKFLKMD